MRQAPRKETRKQQPRDRGDRQEKKKNVREDRQERQKNEREDRKDDRDEAREDRQDYRDKARENRQDFIEDEWDEHYHYYGDGAYYGVAVGSTSGTTYVTNVPCNTTVIVNRTTYYHCGTTWYTRGSESGEVVYIIVSAPEGH
jgi:hypothetical protein